MFQVINRSQFVPSTGKDSVYLKVDLWNDYSFITMFSLSLHDETGNYHEIGEVKIGFKGQTTSSDTYLEMPQSFEELNAEYFALGQSVEFYKNMSKLGLGLRNAVLGGLRDIVHNPGIIELIEDEEVFSVSLLRAVSLSVVRGQFANVLKGLAERTDFDFVFVRKDLPNLGGVELDFKVKALSTPSTNIHAVIGRNGVGKTTLLNGMIRAITNLVANERFVKRNFWGESVIEKDYFSSLVSVSFSAFDPFDPPQEQPDPAKGTCYFYVGLKDPSESGRHKDTSELRDDCITHLKSCLSNPEKAKRWRRSIDKLGSDENFASMNLSNLIEVYSGMRKLHPRNPVDDSEFDTAFRSAAREFLKSMSSGHAIVLLTTSYLVSRVEEKTLLLLDEPESHLHPPLLSAFVRALSDLLHDKNGVAIIATHSPVVLQEVPKSCVWKINRSGLSMAKSRPDIETFGENLGLLTSEIFSLEVERSGFHALLAEDVAADKDYSQIIEQYNGQLGLEGRSILRAMIANRDRVVNG